jgi:hypothetical protein
MSDHPYVRRTVALKHMVTGKMIVDALKLIAEEIALKLIAEEITTRYLTPDAGCGLKQKFVSDIDGVQSWAVGLECVDANHDVMVLTNTDMREEVVLGALYRHIAIVSTLWPGHKFSFSVTAEQVIAAVETVKIRLQELLNK